jgi:KaiC/GvpD/RAD55 family RecA-like ATPase
MVLNELNKLIDRGFKEDVYLLRGPSGSGKTSFCLNLMKDFLDNGKKCVYLCTEDSPEEIKEIIKREFNWNFSEYEKKGLLYFIDASVKKHIEDVVNVRNLNELSIKISEKINTIGNFYFFFDTLSTAIIYNGIEPVVKFIEDQIEKFEENKICAFFVLETIHSKEVIDTLSYFFDGVFEFKIEEGSEGVSRVFRIFYIKGCLHETSWFEFKLTKEGLKFIGLLFKD